MSLKIDKGIAAAILAPLFIALSIILTKLAGSVAPPLIIAGLGSLLSIPFLLCLQLITKSDLQLLKILKELRAPFLKVLITRAIFGQALIITGFTLTTAIKAVLLLRLEPVFVFGWSLLFHNEKPQTKKILVLMALLAGSAMVVAPHNSIDGPNIGDAFVVASLLFLSYSYIPTQVVVEKASPAGLNILTNAIGGLIITAVAFCCPHQPSQLSARAIWLIIEYSVVFFVVAASLYFYAFKTLKPWVIASFLSLEVVFGIVLAFFMLGEAMNPFQFLGAAIVLVATAAIGRLR